MSCAIDGGCAPAPLVRDWRLVKRVSSDDFALGKEVSVRFRELEAKRNGRHVHVRALRIVTTLAIAAHGTPANEARTHHFLKSLIHAIQLSDSSGWKYLDGLDGRSLDDHAFFDRGMFLTPPHLTTAIPAGTALEGLTTNDASGVSCRMTWEIDLAGRVGDQTERLISVASLQARESEALKFRVRSSLPNPGSASYGAITFAQPTSGSQAAGVEVWADVIELDALNEPPRWGLREYERREASGSFDHPEATHLYLVIRPFAEDEGTTTATGETLVDDYDSITLKVGGEDVLANTPHAEVRYRDLAIMESEPRSFHSELVAPAAGYLRNEAGGGSYGMLMLLPPRPRESAPAGRINYRFGTFGPAKVRVLHHFVMCGDPKRSDEIKRSAGIKAAVGYQRDPRDGAVKAVAAGSKLDTTAAVLHVETA